MGSIFDGFKDKSVLGKWCSRRSQMYDFFKNGFSLISDKISLRNWLKIWFKKQFLDSIDLEEADKIWRRERRGLIMQTIVNEKNLL